MDCFLFCFVSFYLFVCFVCFYFVCCLLFLLALNTMSHRYWLHAIFPTLFHLPPPFSFLFSLFSSQSLDTEVSDMNFAVLMQVITFHISPTPPLFSAGVLCSGDGGCGSGPGAVETEV